MPHAKCRPIIRQHTQRKQDGQSGAGRLQTGKRFSLPGATARILGAHASLRAYLSEQPPFYRQAWLRATEERPTNMVVCIQTGLLAHPERFRRPNRLHREKQAEGDTHKHATVISP